MKKYQHTGGDIAHRALLAYYPEINAGVILMSNNGNYSLGIGNEIADVFFGNKLEAKKEEVKTKGSENPSKSEGKRTNNNKKGNQR